MPASDKIIFPHGGYRRLKSFQIAQLIYDITVPFCDRYIPKGSRTHDQMIQAARSGVQNIAEGSSASGTSKKTELKLTNVARASLEELRLDFEDFLRHREMEILHAYHPVLMRFKSLRCRDLTDLRSWLMQERTQQATEEGTRPSSEMLIANAALSLIHLAGYLLDRQINSLAADFEKNGGFSERLYRARKTGQ